MEIRTLLVFLPQELTFLSISPFLTIHVSIGGCRLTEFGVVAWEWTAKGEITKDIPGVPFQIGETFDSVGCSLFWWKEGTGSGENGGEGGIARMAEYSKFVGV